MVTSTTNEFTETKRVDTSISNVSNFLIQLDSDISLAQLSHLKNQGYSILRGAHSGNLRSANLITADQDFTFLLEECLSLEEPNYRPATIICAGQEKRLCSPSDKIALWQSETLIGSKYASPIHRHILSICQRFSNAKPLSSFLLENIQPETLRMLLSNFFSVDTNVAHALITAKGEKIILNTLQAKEKLDFQTTENLLKYHFETIENSLLCGKNPLTTILPDTATLIVLCSIAESLNPNLIYSKTNITTAHIYHLAGVRMIDYLYFNSSVAQAYQHRINVLYSCARVLLPMLPEKIIFHLVPTSHFSNFTTESGEKGLTEILKLAKQYREMNILAHAEKHNLLAGFQLELENIHNFNALKNFISSVAAKIPIMITELKANERKFDELSFERNSERTKRKFIGVLASYVQSATMQNIQNDLTNISNKILKLREDGAVCVREITQYDLDELRPIGGYRLVPDSVLELSLYEFAELSKIISRV